MTIIDEITAARVAAIKQIQQALGTTPALRYPYVYTDLAGHRLTLESVDDGHIRLHSSPRTGGAAAMVRVTLDAHEVRRLHDTLGRWLERVVGARLRAKLAELVERDERLDHAPSAGNPIPWGFRNALVHNVVGLASTYGLVAGYGRDDSIPGYELVAYVDLPTGQVSWHLPSPDDLVGAPSPAYPGGWDGHTRSDKARRIAAYLASAEGATS